MLTVESFRAAKRRILYWLRHDCPYVRGSVHYFGTRLYFPRHSSVAKVISWGGVFEAENVWFLKRLTSHGGWLFDVGANIGAIALPLLEGNPDTHVVSFEPSPNSLPFLRRTHAGSPYRDRWTIVEKALSDTESSAFFHIGEAGGGAFDGFADTARAGPSRKIIVPATTLDSEWARLGRPRVAAIKIDVEGAELGVLAGARECLAAQRPPVLIEWNATNLRAYGRASHTLLDLVKEHGFDVHGVPGLVRATDAADLALLMLQTESFLLWPSDRHQPLA